MENKENDKSTLEFIQLVKCIIEYYGTTKSKNEDSLNKTYESEIEKGLSEAEKLLGSIEDFDLSNMSIDIPSEIDGAIKATFLSQLKKFEDISKYINS